MVKGGPFLEVFATALHEDYRFPLLELFVFLYALSSFVFANVPFSFGGPSEATAHRLTSSILGQPLVIFLILIFKNVAYGLGNDLEKGIIQTYFTYPLKRRGILTAKLLSAIGVAIVLFLTIQISALYVLAPDVVSPYLGTVLVTYVANLCPSLFLTGILLLVTLLLRKGGVALVAGIVLFFALSIGGELAMFVASSTASPLPLQLISIISPGTALGRYYSPNGALPDLWSPVFSEVLLYIGAGYVVVALLFTLGYLYFSRRLGL